MSHYSHGVFHESYFDHICKVETVTEKDVLETDITGKGWGPAFRRWFHSWFLLSYKDPRCRIYYVSSQALRLARVHHFRKYCGRIHPLSRFSNVWRVLMFIVTAIGRVLFCLNTAQLFGRQSPFLLITGIVLEIILLADLLVNFLTGYTNESKRYIILDSSKCIVHYMTSKFFIHVLSSIPVQCIMMLRYSLASCLLCRANFFVCYLKMLGSIGIVRLFDVSSFLSQEKTSFTRMHICKCFRIAILTLMTMMQLIDLFDTINVIIVLNGQSIPEKSYLSFLIRIRLLLYKTPDILYICIQLTILCKIVMIFGYAMLKHDFYLDKTFSLICHFVSSMFGIWTLMEIISIVNRKDYVSDEIEINKEEIKHLMRTNKISNALCDDVHHYNETKMSFLRAVENKNYIYNSMPDVLTKEIKLSCYFRYFRRIPHFSEWPLDLVEELVNMMTVEDCLEHDIVIQAFQQGDGLYIIFAGSLAVYDTNQKETGHLIDGDYFGIESLVFDREILLSSVVAITTCQILLLRKDVFRKVMQSYPKLFYELRTVLLQKPGPEK